MVRESVVPCPCGCHCHPDEILARINTELAGAGRGGRASWLAARSRPAVAQIHLTLVPTWAGSRPEQGAEEQMPSAATSSLFRHGEGRPFWKGGAEGHPKEERDPCLHTWWPSPGGDGGIGHTGLCFRRRAKARSALGSRRPAGEKGRLA